MASGSILFTALLFFVVESSVASGSCVNMSSFSTQLELMLAEYDRAEPPPGPVRVRAALDVHHATIDDRAATVRLLAAMHLSWEDKRLSWNATAWGCHNSMTASEKLWLPDVNALNAVTSGNAAGVGLRARLASDGRVAWVLRFDLTAPLSLQLDAWPRDEQHAAFKFGSRHRGAAFNLSVDDLAHELTVFESGTWELTKVTSMHATWRGGDVVGWTVALRRRAAAHALAAGSVLAAAALLLLGAALLPPAARPPLCAVAALTAALWLMSALARVPAASGAPLRMRLLSGACACAALLCAGAALVQRAAACTAPPPPALRALVTSASSLCRLTPPAGSAAEWSAWAAAAQLLDRALLAAILFTLFVLVCVFVASP